jgi:undecaprenyl-diphosphatase
MDLLVRPSACCRRRLATDAILLFRATTQSLNQMRAESSARLPWRGKDRALTILEAVILGIVQGVFMFVPVSSTAHLVITQHLMINAGSSLPPPESPEMILFDLILHVGTLVSIVIVFWSSLRFLLVSTLTDMAGFARRPGGWGAVGGNLRLMIFGAVTVLVTGVLGLIFKERIEVVFGAPHMVAVTLAITAVLLWLTDRLGPRPIGLKGIGFRIAIIIGIAQAVALVPGISRSGITIIAGLFAGLRRRWAAEYSFLVAIPTILAATVVQGLREVEPGAVEALGYAPLLVGFVVSAAVGTVALKLVLVLLYRAQRKVFSVYLFIMAGFVALGFLDGLL